VAVTVREGARTDYAANGGSSANCPPLSRLLAAAATAPQNTRITLCYRPPSKPANGRTSTLPLQAIINGHAQHEEDTLACDDPVDDGDAEPMIAGYSGNTLRWGGLTPPSD
jgi:hypothetical protein